MESQPRDPVHPQEAREQLEAARRIHDATVRRASAPTWFILAGSVYCGVVTVAPAYGAAGSIAIALTGAVFAVLIGVALSQRIRVRFSQLGTACLLAALLALVVFLAGVLGSFALAWSNQPAIINWGVGLISAAAVGACLFASNVGYQRQAARAWSQ